VDAHRYSLASPVNGRQDPVNNLDPLSQRPGLAPRDLSEIGRLRCILIKNLRPLSTGGKMGKYALVVALLVGLSDSTFARDDGRYANDPLKYWFDNLTSSNGNCCSFADGLSISDVDWDTKDGHYRVLLHGQWINVPNSSVVTEPNRYGPAVVWPYMDTDGNVYIRCFLPGAGI
jgi:hypothetical protein